MNCRLCIPALGIAALTATLAFAAGPTDNTNPNAKKAAKDTAQNTAKQAAPEGMPDFQLPPGWTMEDMQACMIAGTPGPMHARLAQDVGTWHGKNTMWMAPGMEPMHSESTTTISSIMDGRYTKAKIEGDMPGMGPFNGMGLYGYDNTTQKFQCLWIDNHGTGMMLGTGSLSSDGSTMTWTYNYTCPLTKKPAVMREIERTTGENTKTMEMYATDPKSGKEYKMMEVALTRAAKTTAAASPAAFSDKTLEVACGSCVYHMPGVKGCQLATKIDGKPYLVTGADHVDAHQFCTAPKKATVSGAVKGDKVVASKLVVQAGNTR